MLHLGIDTGGTYTDFFARYKGRSCTYKVPSTPRNPYQALVQGLDYVKKALRVAPAAPMDIVYGSTIATNALLERRGGRIALITTSGFEDVLEIGRQARPSLYDLDCEEPKGLVPRSRRFGCEARVSSNGTIEKSLDLGAIDALCSTLKKQRVEAVAVCLLFSYANAKHERMIADALTKHGFQVSRSSELLPEHREYERTVTTVVNAYLQPKVGRALRQLEGAAAARRFSVMQSNGGRLGVTSASRQPVRLLLSGPVGGALGAWEVARRCGVRQALALDMGGTSTDVCLLDGAPPDCVQDSVLSGLPLRIPMLDIHTVGSGGGSIASCDRGGALRVGPESAGADPGPACLGGDRPTLTDAHVVLGRIRPDFYLGGRQRPSLERAERALHKLGKRLGLSKEHTSLGILRVANINMENALQVVSLEKGMDPRQFVLLAYGGAAGLHAADLVAALDMRAALIPSQAAVLSAFGMAHSKIARDYAASVMQVMPVASMQNYYKPLLTQARREMRQEGVQRPRLERSVALRYRGQSFELEVPFTTHLEKDFHALHLKRYGFESTTESIEVVGVRLRATGSSSRSRKPLSAAQPARFPELLKPQSHSIWWPSTRGVHRQATRFLMDTDLKTKRYLRGPAVIVRADTTVLVPPDFRCRRTDDGDLYLTRSQKS